MHRRKRRAVTPVIGIILIVAITVIIGGVVGSFAFDFGSDGNLQPAPTTEIDFDYSAETEVVEVTHLGGDTFQQNNIRFAGAANNGTNFSDSQFRSEKVQVTDTANVDVIANQGEVLKVIWQSNEGGSIHVVSEYEVPNEAMSYESGWYFFTARGWESETAINESVRMTANVKNDGDNDGNKPITLTVYNDTGEQVVGEKTFKLAVEAGEEVKFDKDIQFDEDKVEVGDTLHIEWDIYDHIEYEKNAVEVYEYGDGQVPYP